MQPGNEEEKIWKIIEQVTDPEVPVLSILDLGVVRSVDITKELITITITPTYSGCPAMGVIEEDIIAALAKENYNSVEVKTVLFPTWTTDWMTENGKKKLKEYGIAPPANTTADKSWLLGEEKAIQCPRCNSMNTTMVSQFGSTACKALHKCNECLEPFDYFKCI